MNNFIVGNADAKSDPARFLWNGFVLRHVRNEAEYNLLIVLGVIKAGTLAAPVWISKSQLDTYPIV
jgi:hypothetical protein